MVRQKPVPTSYRISNRRETLCSRLLSTTTGGVSAGRSYLLTGTFLGVFITVFLFTYFGKSDNSNINNRNTNYDINIINNNGHVNSGPLPSFLNEGGPLTVSSLASSKSSNNDNGDDETMHSSLLTRQDQEEGQADNVSFASYDNPPQDTNSVITDYDTNNRNRNDDDVGTTESSNEVEEKQQSLDVTSYNSFEDNTNAVPHENMMEEGDAGDSNNDHQNNEGNEQREDDGTNEINNVKNSFYSTENTNDNYGKSSEATNEDTINNFDHNSYSHDSSDVYQEEEGNYHQRGEPNSIEDNSDEGTNNNEDINNSDNESTSSSSYMVQRDSTTNEEKSHDDDDNNTSNYHNEVNSSNADADIIIQSALQDTSDAIEVAKADEIRNDVPSLASYITKSIGSILSNGIGMLTSTPVTNVVSENNFDNDSVGGSPYEGSGDTSSEMILTEEEADEMRANVEELIRKNVTQELKNRIEGIVDNQMDGVMDVVRHDEFVGVTDPESIVQDVEKAESIAEYNVRNSIRSVTTSMKKSDTLRQQSFAIEKDYLENKLSNKFHKPVHVRINEFDGKVSIRSESNENDSDDSNSPLTSSNDNTLSMNESGEINQIEMKSYLRKKSTIAETPPFRGYDAEEQKNQLEQKINALTESAFESSPLSAVQPLHYEQKQVMSSTSSAAGNGYVKANSHDDDCVEDAEYECVEVDDENDEDEGSSDSEDRPYSSSIPRNNNMYSSTTENINQHNDEDRDVMNESGSTVQYNDNTNMYSNNYNGNRGDTIVNTNRNDSNDDED